MSWESTELYYRLINEETRRRLGGLHSAPVLLHSFDFHEIERLQLIEILLPSFQRVSQIGDLRPAAPPGGSHRIDLPAVEFGRIQQVVETLLQLRQLCTRD